MTTETIDVTRTPLNSMRAARVTLTEVDAWVTVFAPPRYRKVATPVTPEATSETTATVTNAYVCNLGAVAAVVSLRTLEGETAFPVVNEVQIAPEPATNTPLNMRSGVIRSGEILQARLDSGPSCAVHVSYMLRTEEIIEEP